MNLDASPTMGELRQLLAQENDRAGHHLLWVDRNGNVHVSLVRDERAADELEKARPDMQLRYETFLKGNEYFGPEAAADDGWVVGLFQSLQQEWQKAKGKGEVAHVELW
jgi:hypothetical protein